jgi:hypothetical protein
MLEDPLCEVEAANNEAVGEVANDLQGCLSLDTTATDACAVSKINIVLH